MYLNNITEDESILVIDLLYNFCKTKVNFACAKNIYMFSLQLKTLSIRTSAFLAHNV